MTLRLHSKARLFLATLLAAGVVTGEARQQPPPARATGTVAEGVTAVLVDVVVRDKRGQPVRDLTESDFEVLEDRVPQKIGSFTPVTDGAPSAPPPPATSTTSAPSGAAAPNAAAGAPAADPGPLVTALVFDRLTPESQRAAVKAAQSYLGDKTETPNYIGIFSVDLAMTPYAPFTKNARILREALQRMEGRAASTFNTTDQRQAKSDADQAAATSQQLAANAQAGAGGAGGSVGTATGDAMLAQIESRMINEFNILERDQQGYSTTNGLFSIISTLRALPGRKSLVLFSEGLAIPPAVTRLFTGVVAAANRANVSIYTMDAAGLRAESEDAKTRDQVNMAAAGGGGIQSSAGGGGALSKGFEENEAVLRQNPRSGLSTLAQDTGGVFYAGTNNLRQGFDRVEADLRNYYLVGYTPANDTYDGRYRTIEVKVKRPGVTVAARKGYFAVRNVGTGSISAAEAMALAGLERKPVPNAFPVRAGTLLFPEADRPGLVPIVVTLGTAPLSFQTTEDGKAYTSDFTVLVRLLDEKERVVRQVSQHYEVKGPIAEIDRAKQGEVIFYREAELAPGVYTMETIVHDAPSDKASVRITTVEVPRENPDRLRMSSLVLVKRSERVPEKDRRAGNPLLVNDVVLSPNLGDPVSKSTKELPFYFAAYPAKSGPAPEATLDLLRDGAVIAQVPLPLSAPDASGRIQQVGRLPLDAIAPGLYELRVVVKQGTAQVSRALLLRIAD